MFVPPTSTPATSISSFLQRPSPADGASSWRISIPGTEAGFAEPALLSTMFALLLDVVFDRTAQLARGAADRFVYVAP